MKIEKGIAGALAAGLLAVMLPARAQQPLTPPQNTEWTGGRMDFYLGGALGYAKADVSVNLPSGFWYDSSTTQDTNQGWKLYAGWEMFPGIAAELGFTRLGRFSFNGSAQPGATVSQTYRVLGYTADIVATMHLIDRLSLLARIGGYYHDTTPEISTTGSLTATPQNSNDRQWSLRTGLGLQYDLARNWGLRAEWEQFRKMGANNLNADLYSLGVVYHMR